MILKHKWKLCFQNDLERKMLKTTMTTVGFINIFKCHKQNKYFTRFEMKIYLIEFGCVLNLITRHIGKMEKMGGKKT